MVMSFSDIFRTSFHEHYAFLQSYTLDSREKLRNMSVSIVAMMSIPFNNKSYDDMFSAMQSNLMYWKAPVLEFVDRVVLAMQLMIMMITSNRQPGLYNMEDQNLSDAYKQRIGATGGRPLTADRGLKPHLTPSSGIRDVFTPDASFGNVSRGDPLPYQLGRDQLVRAGLTRDTWKLTIVADDFVQKHHVKFATKVENSRVELTFDAMMMKVETGAYKTVRYMKAMQVWM